MAISTRPVHPTHTYVKVELNLEQTLQQEVTTRSAESAIPAALAAVDPGAQSALVSALRFPGDDGGRSLAKMAESDLDAALQLLADRARYITGANGAAIALRRHGRNDMLCRASTGSNVPELGALLSTEFGLSGESVRTRKALRCDDAERDPRVNREGCRQLGIASVVVMPVVNDDEVMGVFELFSGKVNAFGERDLSALQRLSEMVETAVRLARAAESVPQHAMNAEIPVAVGAAAEGQDDAILDDNILEDEVLSHAIAEVEEAVVVEEPVVVVEGEAPPMPAFVITEDVPASPAAVVQPSAPAVLPSVQVAPHATVQNEPPKKPLFWSAASNPTTDAGQSPEPDLSHVPPVLRNLRTCDACGFPVSPGRALCVECEEKKWRGQLRRPQKVALAVATQPRGMQSTPASVPAPVQVERAFAAAQSAASAPAARQDAPAISAGAVRTTLPAVRLTEVTISEPKEVAKPAPVAAPRSEDRSRDFVLSAGLEPSQSWLGAHKYIVGILLLAAAAGAAFVFLR